MSFQALNFRVLKFDQNLRPSNRANDTADVYVNDPQGTRLFQFKGVHLGRGIQQRQFPLADEPTLGSWTITVDSGKDSQSASFQVKEYKLPKFDVSITFPPYVLLNAKTIPVQVCAKYTYGEPVQGTLNLNTSLEIYSYSYSYDRTPIIQRHEKIDGCYNYSINVTSLDPDHNYYYRRIMVVANFIEDGTGVERNQTQYLSRTSSPLNLNFDADRSQKHYFKPGLPFTGRLKVTNPDDTPANGEPIGICATVSRKRVIGRWLAQNTEKYCKNYTSDANGYIKYALEPQNVDSISISIEAKSLNAKNIRLLYTAKGNTNFKLNYQIMSKGRVVSTNTKQVTFNPDDDVSSKFEKDNDLIDATVTQIVPTPDLSSASSSSESDSIEDSCPEAREFRYTPPVGEVHIPINVQASYSPSLTLLVFYVREDGETVADSQKIDVEKCFQNKVDFEFGDEEQQPGAQTTVRVTAAPHSMCGLKIVDKSVSLLDSSDQLSKDNIFQLVEDMNRNNYYNSNPCYKNIPQPGLQSSSPRSSSIQPSYSASSYEDSLASFQEAGYLVISNLILFTRPCSNNGPQPQPISGPVRPRLAFAAPAAAFGPAAPGGAAIQPDGKPVKFVVPTTSVKDVRDYFPETWLFQLQMTGSNGVFMSKETLPDTVTEWEGSAVCINPKEGLGLSNVTSIKGFQAFFISYNLPISVIRGEEFTVVVSIFSYVDDALPVTVTLEQPQGFTVANDSSSGDICVQPNTSNSIKLQLKATDVGMANITVRAETASSNTVCGNSPVYGSLARDAIKQSFEVEAEGFPNQKVHSILFCPKDQKNGMFSQNYNLTLPKDVVPDSARAIVDVTGNVLGPAIQNLNSLVSLPTGCGEQNMVKFTPNYLVLDYLTDIGKLTDDIKSMAIRNLNTGYQRELNYRHYDGSFSAFGQTDNEGSMFLTAFVLRSFYEAQRYITIDDNLLTDMQKWITDRQQANGCFPNVGRIIDTGIQGGLEGEKNQGAITAYVVASLLISKFQNQTVINQALSCLSNNPPANPYETFLYSYAEALSGDNDDAESLINQIKPRAITKGGMEYYRNPNGTTATNIETVAYAVLSNLKVGNSKSDIIPLVRYLTSNLNPQGGFSSTQAGTRTTDPKQCQEKTPQTITEPPWHSVNLACKIHGFMSLTPYSQPPVGSK
ncbi:alpha-2-macroglobulin [Trichonephila clavipes]|nr:alpha-2-macroglobulin [Trichonephila clavipes]